jgi:hypothetical protein
VRWILWDPAHYEMHDPRVKPYRSAPLAPDPTLADQAASAFLAESAHQSALARIGQSIAERSTAAIDNTDGRPSTEYLAGQQYLELSASESRREAMDRVSFDRLATEARRQAGGLGRAGLCATSGSGARYRIGYCYDTTTHAAKSRPTNGAPVGDRRPADALTRLLERGSYSAETIARRVTLALECGEVAYHDAKLDPAAPLRPYTRQEKDRARKALQRARRIDALKSRKL